MWWSEVNMQELKNALERRRRKSNSDSISRTQTEITLKEKEKELVVVSDDEYKLNAVQEIIKGKS